jgi:hypothetical protein
MWPRVIGAVSIVVLAWRGGVQAQRLPPVHPDLQGIWNAATSTPLQRPAEFKDRETFTPEEAAAFLSGAADRVRSRLPTEVDRLMQADIENDFVERESMPFDRFRTSLIVEPSNGLLPSLLPTAQARVAARPKRSFDDPEVLGLGERCLLANFGAGGSLASPPMVPSPVIPGFYQIVQTEANVLIFTEWMHDARIVRMNSTHLPSSIRKWLGDSIGYWDGPTLVVDTTNFRSEVHNLDSSERLHVVERFTRMDKSTLRYRATVDDPDTWATRWTAEWHFRRSDARIFPVECHEGNYAVEAFLKGARLEERRR